MKKQQLLSCLPWKIYFHLSIIKTCKVLSSYMMILVVFYIFKLISSCFFVDYGYDVICYGLIVCVIFYYLDVMGPETFLF